MMEQTSEMCRECWRFNERRWGKDGNETGKPKEPEGWGWMFLLIAACTLSGVSVAVFVPTPTTIGQISLTIVSAVAMVSALVIMSVAITEFVSFIRNTVIGYPMFVFADQGGGLHRHLTEPIAKDDTRGKRIANVRQYQMRGCEALHLVADAPILRLRVGGWFRTCAIIEHARWTNSVGWSIARCWRGPKDLVLHDGDGGEIGSPRFMVEEFFTMLQAGGTVPFLIRRGKCMEEELKEARGTALMFAYDHDRLGVAILVALRRIERNRKTLGVSKHAQGLREHFEKVLATIPDERRDELLKVWGARAADILDAEVREKESPAPAPAPAAVETGKSLIPDRDSTAT